MWISQSWNLPQILEWTGWGLEEKAMQDGCRGVVSVARWTGLCRPSSSLYLSQCHTFQLKAGWKDLMVLVGKLTCKLGRALQGTLPILNHMYHLPGLQNQCGFHPTGWCCWWLIHLYVWNMCVCSYGCMQCVLVGTCILVYVQMKLYLSIRCLPQLLHLMFLKSVSRGAGAHHFSKLTG